jgi:Zn-dependent M28 family amino/carboxypeptidase
LIEMADAAVKHARAFRRSVVFAAFAGEELGLLGSQHYVSNLPAGVTRTVAMINLDMVGRARGRVLIGGVEQHAILKTIVEELRPLTMLRLDDFRQGYGAGASDNDSFERQHVPTMQFFTGFHADYHRASDDWQRIDAAGAAEIGRIALAAVARLSSSDALVISPGSTAR